MKKNLSDRKGDEQVIFAAVEEAFDTYLTHRGWVYQIKQAQQLKKLMIM
jgi:hypothetical protein